MSTPTPYSVAHGGVSNARTQQSAEDATLQDLFDAHSEPAPVGMRAAEYHAADKSTRTELKKGLAYFVGGTLKGRRHDTAVRARTLLTLDVEEHPKADTVPPPPEEVVARLKELGGAGWVYTSLSHTAESPRYRVVLPLGEPISGDLPAMQQALEASTKAAAKRLGIDTWTRPESWTLSQPMYLPARLRGGAFYQKLCTGKAWRVVARSGPDRVDGGPADIPDERPDEVLVALKAAGLYLHANKRHKGMHFIRCPFHEQHGAVNDSQTVYYEAYYDGNPRAAVKCFDTEPDEDGKPHLTYATLVRWLREQGHLTQEQQTQAGVLDDYDTFDAKADLANMLDGEPVAREWAINQLAPIGKVTVIAGPGGVSKSMLMLHLLVHAAMEQPWGGFTTDTALRSLYVSYEDDKQELHKRVSTLARALRGQDDGLLDTLYDVNGTIRKNLRMFAADDEAAAWLLLTKPDRFGPPERTERVEWLVGYLKAKRIKLLCLDPAVYTHQLEENNIADMAVFMQTLTYIAKQAQCAVVVLHHMNKVSAWAALDEINQGSLRGASSFADNARSVAVVVSMPLKDAETYGLQPDPAVCSKYAVFKHVKHNYSAPLPTVILERKGALLLPRPELQRLDASHVQQAREEAKAQAAEARVVAAAPQALKVLAEAHPHPISQNQVGIPNRWSPQFTKKVLAWCAEQDYTEREESDGLGKASGHVITKAGLQYLRAVNR